MYRCFIFSFIRSFALLALLPVVGHTQISDSQKPQSLFLAAPSYPVFSEAHPERVTAIVAEDVDHRNGPDIVSVQTNGVLNVLYNDGEGRLQNSYQNNSAMSANPSISYIQSADLNGDGFRDVVACDTRNSAFLIFLNKADGTFQDAISVAVGSENGARLAGGALAVSDVNGDGRPDVITISRAANPDSTLFSQQVYLQGEDGVFQPGAAVDSSLPGAFIIPPGQGAHVADLNRDGKLDLVVQLEQSRPQAAAIVAVALGTADRTFAPISIDGPATAAGPQPASSLRLADLNSDDLPDCVLVTYSNQVLVALGQGDGTFASLTPIHSQMTGAVLVETEDVDQDGNVDVIVFGSGNLGILLNQGDGQFRLGGQYAGGYGIFQQPVPKDFNQDGIVDIAWLDYTNGVVGLYAGRGNGSFAAARPVYPVEPDGPTWANNTQVITSADWNGDGNADVLAYKWPHAAAGGPADLVSGINDGAGNFSFQLALPAGKMQELASRYGAIIVENATADFNNDRLPDLIFRTQNGLSVLLAKGDGTFHPDPLDVSFPVPVGCIPVKYLTVGDVNGDGTTDIAASYQRNENCAVGSTTPSGFFVLLGDGAGHFQATFTAFGDTPFFVRLADFNNDGRLDLAVANSIANRGFTLHLLPGRGDGAFDTNAGATPIANEWIGNILVSDYNGDGKEDLVLSSSGASGPDGQPVPETSGLVLLPGNGDFTFGALTRHLSGARSITDGVAAADVTGDGAVDIVFAVYSKNPPYSSIFGLTVLPNNGDGTFGAPTSEISPLSVDGRKSIPFVADFNRDGQVDVLTGSGQAGTLFLNRGR